MIPRLLLLLPSTTYRAEEFLDAAKKLGVEVSVASDHTSTLAHSNRSGLLALDFGSPRRAVERVVEFSAKYPIDAVLGVDDASVPLAAAIAEALDLPYNTPEAVENARNKYKMRLALQHSELNSPWFRLFGIENDVRWISQETPYPCVLKPLVLSGSRGVIRANNPGEFATAFHRIASILRSRDVAAGGEPTRKILVEAYVPGFEVSLEGLLTEGRLQTLCLFDKPDPMDGPFFEESLYITPSRLSPEIQQQISHTVQVAAETLGLWHGPIHAELRVNDLGIWLLEANPRSIGGRCSRTLRFGTGISLEELIIRHALGLEIPSFDREGCAAGVMMLPIPGRGVLTSVSGQEAASQVPGVDEVLITAHAGQQLVPLPEGTPYLGFIIARADTTAAVESALRTSHRRLDVVIQSSSAT